MQTWIKKKERERKIKLAVRDAVGILSSLQEF